MIKKLVLIVLVLYGGCLSAQNRQEVRDSVKIYFQQGKTELVPSLKSNRSALNRISDSLRTSYADSVYQLWEERPLKEASSSTNGCRSDAPKCCSTTFPATEPYQTH